MFNKVNLFEKAPVKTITSINSLSEYTLVSSWDKNIYLYTKENPIIEKFDVPVVYTNFYNNKIFFTDIRGCVGYICVETNKIKYERISAGAIIKAVYYKDLIICASLKNEIIFIKGLQKVKKINFELSIVDLSIENDTLAILMVKNVIIYDLLNSKVVKKIKLEDRARKIIIYKTDVFIGFESGKIGVYNYFTDEKKFFKIHFTKETTREGNTRLVGHPVNGLEIKDDIFYSIGSDKRLKMIDLKNKKLKTLKVFDQVPTCITKDENGIKVAVSTPFESPEFGKECKCEIFSYSN